MRQFLPHQFLGQNIPASPLRGTGRHCTDVRRRRRHSICFERGKSCSAKASQADVSGCNCTRTEARLGDSCEPRPSVRVPSDASSWRISLDPRSLNGNIIPLFRLGGAMSISDCGPIDVSSHEIHSLRGRVLTSLDAGALASSRIDLAPGY